MSQLQHLHAMYTKDVLMPHFVTQFQCNGPECPLSCCTYFRVGFRKKDYDILENKLNLTAEHKKNYKKHGKSIRSDEKYAEFVCKDDSRVCGFLEDGLCALHRDFGENALPRVCYIYPRLYRVFGKEHTELNLSISCPQVTRLALLQENAFDFVIQTMHFRKDAVAEEKQHFSASDTQSILDLRFFCIQLMRVQDIALWKRVALLGLFSSQLADVLAKPKIARRTEQVSQEIQELISATTSLIEAGEVNAIYEVVEADWNHLTACVIFLVHMQQHWLQNKQDDYIANFYQVIVPHISPESDDLVEIDSFDFQFVLQNHQQGLKHLQASLKNHPYFLEHFLLSELFELSFPFCFKAQLPIAFLYRYLCFVYVFMRFVLAVYCVHEEKTAEELSFVIAKFMRFLQHVDLHTLKDLMHLEQLHWEDWGLLYAHLKDDL